MINENTPTLQTERLILRRFVPSDAGALFSLLRDKEVNTFLPWFPLTTLEEAERFLKERFFAYYDKPSAYRYALCMREDDIPVGYICLSDDESHDFGYGLKKEFWHRGLVTEGARAVVDRLRAAGYPYVTATHDVHNPRSGGVMRNLGMTYRYSYVEQWQPKNIPVTFRMYQLNLDGCTGRVYREYWDKAQTRFIETNI